MTLLLSLPLPMGLFVPKNLLYWSKVRVRISRCQQFDVESSNGHNLVTIYLQTVPASLSLQSQRPVGESLFGVIVKLFTIMVICLSCPNFAPFPDNQGKEKIQTKTFSLVCIKTVARHYFGHICVGRCIHLLCS